MKFKIPDKFIDRYREIVDDPDAFIDSIHKYLPKTFRINTLKAERKLLLERFKSYGFNLVEASWYSDAFTVDSLEIGSTLEHFLGWIYIQEFTSMTPPLLVLEELKNANFILDCCAAPGSKTTQIAAIKENLGTIVANDKDFGRIRALRFNLEKTGVLNTIITNKDLLNLKSQNPFNLVFLDAPCSAEGTIRKSFGVATMWNENLIKFHSALQKKLILKAYDLLENGGTMVYSTCTFAPEEDEEVLTHLVQNREGAKIVPSKIDGFKTSKPLDSFGSKVFDSQVKNALRIWPHHNDTDGFFLAKVVKNE